MKKLLPFLILLAACEEDPVELKVEPVIRPILTIVSGDTQQSAPGFQLKKQPTVLVTDSTGAPLPGVEVYWRVLEGAGTLNTDRTHADSSGRASVMWTMGEDVGMQLLYASANNSPGVTFRASTGQYYASVAAGWRHSCALDLRGLAYCWGNNQWGQLGDGTKTASTEGVVVAGRTQFARIYPGWLHTCALDSDGDAYCWGENATGQLGDGTSIQRTTPVLVLGGQKFKELTLGLTHTCGVTITSELYCWGSQQQGQVGVTGAERCTIENVPCFRLPERVALPAPGVVVAVAAGENHTCAVTGTQRLYCWGPNNWGQLGIGAFGGGADSPQLVSSAVLFKDVAASANATCAIASNDTAYCWGANANGRLGTGNSLNAAAPSAVVGGDAFVDLAMGTQHTCGRTASGTILCWGALLGNGTTTASNQPVQLTGTYSALAVGGAHTCAYDAGIWCWGSNADRQLGVAAPANQLSPLKVRPGPPAGFFD